MRESLEELAQNVDVLVDRLTMDMADTPLEDAKKPPAAATPAPPESPEEVAALAEGMIDSLTVPEPEASPEPEAKTEAKTKAKTRSKPKPAAKAATAKSLKEASSPGQYSEMIDAELDKMFGKYETGDSKPKPAQAKAAPPKAAKTAKVTKTAKTSTSETSAPAGKPSPPPKPTEVAKPATAAPKAEPAPAREVVIPWSDVRQPARPSAGRMWMVAAGVLVVGAIAIGLWFMFSPGDQSSGAAPIAGPTGPGQETGGTTNKAGSSLVTPFDIGQRNRSAEPSATVPTDEPPVDVTRAPVADPVPETTGSPDPEPEPVEIRTEKPPAPKPAKADPAPPVRSAATTKPVEKPEPEPARAAAPAPPPAKPEPKPVPKTEPEPEPAETTTPPAKSPEEPRPTIDRSTPVEPPRLASTPPPTPPVEAIAEPPVGTIGPGTVSTAPTGEITPPELVSRQEPQLTERELKRGKGGVVVLRVLVSDRGRVTRVIIEDPMQGTAFEARAIDSALRSVYRPAMQDGEPVEAWVTERFAFVP